MFERRPVWFSVTVPQTLLCYLHELNFDLQSFLKHELQSFFRWFCDYCTGPTAFAHVGAHVVSICPTFRVIVAVGTPELESGDELAANCCSDLLEHLQCMLRMKLRDAGIEPNLAVLNLLQVSQEEDFLD
nr:E4-2 [Simian adenovirus GZ3-12]